MPPFLGNMVSFRVAHAHKTMKLKIKHWCLSVSSGNFKSSNVSNHAQFGLV